MGKEEPPLMYAASGEADGVVRDGGPLEAAEYVSHALSELSQLARVHRLGMLVYLLDIAKLEADETLRRQSKTS